MAYRCRFSNSDCDGCGYCIKIRAKVGMSINTNDEGEEEN